MTAKADDNDDDGLLPIDLAANKATKSKSVTKRIVAETTASSEASFRTLPPRS